jgi:hypothetical protein
VFSEELIEAAWQDLYVWRECPEGIPLNDDEYLFGSPMYRCVEAPMRDAWLHLCTLCRDENARLDAPSIDVGSLCATQHTPSVLGEMVESPALKVLPRTGRG